MGSAADDKTPREEGALRDEGAAQDEDKRWLNVLEEVVKEGQTGRRWWQNVGILLAWAAGFAVTAALAATLILALVELFQRGRQFTARTLSDYVFWTSALLMVIGALSPSSPDLQRTSGKGKKEDDASEGRATRLLRRRLRRVYDPWRWRLWAGAVLAFGLSVLIGLAIP
jgi:hypothetical protein